MIVRPKLHWLRMLFVWRGSVVVRILPQLCTLVLMAALVVLAKRCYPAYVPDLTPVPFTLLGIALAEELQEPFGTEANDLALDAMTEVIESSLKEMLGEQVNPAPAVPDNCIVT